MIIVTGGAGFIGANIIKQLNARGRFDILVVDDLSNGHQFVNLVNYSICDYMDKDDFLRRIQENHDFGRVDAIFHEGACSDTTVWDGRYMMVNNYEYSKSVLDYALKRRIPFLYASSAAVYGANTTFIEQPRYEAPLNVYGYSKLLFDQWVRRILPTAESQIVGFRYFNVYGPHEQHKGKMASVAYHFNQQCQEQGVCRLFEGTDGIQHGEQLRDFVFVDDVAAVNLWFWDHASQSGIFNVGTGQASSFNAVANAVIQHHGRGEIQYIPFPAHLAGHYQNYTQADLTELRKAGYPHAFTSVAEGVARYLKASA